ncbi:MAG: two-component system phosphate regulon sensor histidine kinase PhoR [Myxococcota bacterium]
MSVIVSTLLRVSDRGTVGNAGALERVLDATAVGMLVVDADGRVVYANRRLEELVHVRASPVGRLLVEALASVEISTLVERVFDGETVEPLLVATGSVDLEVRTQRLVDGGVLVEVLDVTSWRQAERARRDFVANVSHELRTPLTAVMGYAETILTDPRGLPADLVPMVEAVERNARRLRDLFEALLRLHRIETRRRNLPLARLAVLPLLERALVGAADMASERGLVLELNCAPDLDAMVHEEALVTMVTNLARNACQYSDKGGAVTVAASASDDAVVVSVRDRGIGIDPVHHERVFERFYRSNAGRAKRPGGTGLGLAIVRHLALASGCGLSLESTPGQGSEFTIHIPRSPSARSRV